MAAKKPEIHRLISKVNFTDANRGKGKILYLVKHYVGATGGAKANCRYFYDTYRGASAHYFIDHDGEIWQCVEENDIAWHCGASSYKHKECRNSNSIGVEMCVKKDKDGKWYYTEATKKSAIELFAYLADKYEIDADHILRHYDVTGKICGEPDVRSGNKVWSKFIEDIEAYRSEVVTSSGKLFYYNRDGRFQKESSKEYKTEKGAIDKLLKEGKGAVYDETGKLIQSISLESEKKKNDSDVDKKDDGVPYLIQTTCDVLRIRAGAGTHHRQTGEIRETAAQKKKYTITEEKNGWGKLKSGAGWIALAYTKRVG